MANKEQLRILKREGVEAWNQWRKNNPDKEINLRGADLREKNLSGVDFSKADIRSTNFTGATLGGAKFCKAKAGLQKRWAIGLVIVSLFIAFVSGLFSTMSSLGFLYVLSENARLNNDQKIISILILSVINIIFFYVTINKGLVAGISSFAVAGGVAGGVAVAVTFAETGAFGVVAFLGVIAGAGGVAGGVALAGAVAGAVAGAGAFAFAVAVTVAVTTTVAASAVLAVGVVLAGGVAGAFAVTLTVAVGVAVTFVLLSAYIGWRSIKGDERDALVRSFAVAFAATGGTNFQGANLTDANFTKARLKSTDLRKATLTRVCWYGAKMLDRVRPEETYLRNEPLRQLLITGEGQNQNFDRLDLRGINLQNANLQDASFIGTDLNRANLQNANLSGAKLVQTLLEGADLTRATLTGACIEDWGISNTTKLIQIDCDEIFLKLSTKEPLYRQRRPADQERNFEPGEFAKLAQKIPNTVDLVFKDGIDWQTFLKTFQELRVESDTGELPVIQTIENKGDGAFVIRVKVPKQVDEAEYERKFRLKYELKLEAQDKEIKLLCEQKELYSQQIEDIRKNNEDIRKNNTDLMGIVKTMAEKETTKYDQRGAKINIGSYVDTAQSGSHQQGYANQTNYETPDQNLAEAAAEIQKLLEQLSQNNPTTTNRGKMKVVAEVVDQIESNPTLKVRVINSLKAGGTETLKVAINHPLVNILMATIEGWQEAE